MDRRRGDEELKTEDDMVPSDSVVVDAAEEPRNGGRRRPEGGRWEEEERHRGVDAGVELPSGVTTSRDEWKRDKLVGRPLPHALTLDYHHVT
ncbi:hypothetical protein BHE74_00047657 [Ensete ventricosum]|nr:hypothetical protein BHE74_00047657 [Ensete ventricosum]